MLLLHTLCPDVPLNSQQRYLKYSQTSGKQTSPYADTTGTFHSPKNSGIFEWVQMAWEFPWKIFGKSENCCISKMRTIKLKIQELPGGNSNRMEIFGKKFLKI